VRGILAIAAMGAVCITVALVYYMANHARNSHEYRGRWDEDDDGWDVGV